MHQEQDTITVVQAWQNAVNAQDADRLLQYSHSNIELIGPRGSGYGHQLLRDWLARAGLTLETQRTFARDNAVVLAQHGIWRSVETGEIVGEADVALRFVVNVGQVVQFARYDMLDEALQAAGLTANDEVL